MMDDFDLKKMLVDAKARADHEVWLREMFAKYGVAADATERVMERLRPDLEQAMGAHLRGVLQPQVEAALRALIDRQYLLITKLAAAYVEIDTLKSALE